MILKFGETALRQKDCRLDWVKIDRFIVSPFFFFQGHLRAVMFWQIQERKGGAIMPTSRRSPYGVHENDPFLFFNEWYGKATHCIALFQLRNDKLRSQSVNYWCTFFKRDFWCQVICFMWKGFTLKIGKLTPVTNFFSCLYIFRFTFIINSCKILKIFSSFF